MGLAAAVEGLMLATDLSQIESDTVRGLRNILIEAQEWLDKNDFEHTK